MGGGGGVRYPPRQSLGSYQGPPAQGERHGGRPVNSPPQDKQIPFNNPQSQLDPSVESKLSFDDLMYLVQAKNGTLARDPDGFYTAPENFGGGPENFSFDDLMALTMWMKKFQ